jgi:two-component system LytT family response regulator
MALRVLIADDEPLARRRVAQLLAGEPDAEVVGEAEDGAAALEAVAALRPDLLFLDVQMPEVTGLDVLAALAEAEGPVPAVVLATAYDEYALRAFDANAVDYLLKPYKADRFRAALCRARARLRERAAPGADDALRRQVEGVLAALAAERAAPEPAPERLVARVGDRHVFIGLDEVDWLEAEGNYVRVHARGQEHLLREALGRLAGRLPARFVRVHRSAVVNADRIRDVEPLAKGTYLIRLRSGDAVATGRAYRDAVQALLDG